jgi:DNA-binding NarL/FixJ family response regulator
MAVATATAEETTRAALKHRDEAVNRLTEQGWTHPQIAELIGVNRSRVAQIRSRDARRAGQS